MYESPESELEALSAPVTNLDRGARLCLGCLPGAALLPDLTAAAGDEARTWALLLALCHSQMGRCMKLVKSRTADAARRLS